MWAEPAPDRLETALQVHHYPRIHLIQVLHGPCVVEQLPAHHDIGVGEPAPHDIELIKKFLRILLGGVAWHEEGGLEPEFVHQAEDVMNTHLRPVVPHGHEHWTVPVIRVPINPVALPVDIEA